jgi:hypothetical protein
MEGLSGKQSSVPEDGMERGWGEEIQTSVAGDEEKQKKDGCHISIQKLL